MKIVRVVLGLLSVASILGSVWLYMNYMDQTQTAIVGEYQMASLETQPDMQMAMAPKTSVRPRPRPNPPSTSPRPLPRPWVDMVENHILEAGEIINCASDE